MQNNLHHKNVFISVLAMCSVSRGDTGNYRANKRSTDNCSSFHESGIDMWMYGGALYANADM